jgi:hypothetical protein
VTVAEATTAAGLGPGVYRGDRVKPVALADWLDALETELAKVGYAFTYEHATQRARFRVNALRDVPGITAASAAVTLIWEQRYEDGLLTEIVDGEACA